MSNLPWADANQRALMHELAGLRMLLDAQARRHGIDSAPPAVAVPVAAVAPPDMPTPPALQRVCDVFGLSRFERAVLLLCAGMALDGSFGALCAAAQAEPLRPYPSFGLALAVLPDAHWSALLPTSPLRFWRLLQLGAGATLTASMLQIDEKILHYLAGISHLDEMLIGLVEPVALPADPLVHSHGLLAQQMVANWSASPDASSLPRLQLCSSERADIHAIAAQACATLGLRLHRLAARDVPADPRVQQALALLWEREAALNPVALLIDFDTAAVADDAPALRLAERLRCALIIGGCDRLPPLPSLLLTLDVARPQRDEQAGLWRQGLGAAVADDTITQLVAQFDLSAQGIRGACASAAIPTSAPAPAADALASGLWALCRAHTRPRLAQLAQRIDATAGWDDLVLPAPALAALHDIVRQVRLRGRVYDSWGFAATSSRGLGISALFEGASGTGKSLAAEVLARALSLDLYRIDLAQVVSKYIGETEKNLRQVFDAAEGGGAILLFDEADALFGKRSEIRDSHDRYANIEVSYLLQRMESYRGLAILTTNMKAALDTAFLRRIRFVVQFPFPDAMGRAAIWRQVFPLCTPTAGLDADKLARLNLAGGSIRNVALNAAFLAADAGGPVGMAHLLQAARGEYAKLERPLSAGEVAGWI